MSALTLYQIAAFILLAAGIVGLARRRTLVGMLIAVELMLNGAGLALAAAGQLGQTSVTKPGLGQISTLLVMGLAAAEATLILAIIVVVHRRFKSTSTEDITTLKE